MLSVLNYKIYSAMKDLKRRLTSRTKAKGVQEPTDKVEGKALMLNAQKYVNFMFLYYFRQNSGAEEEESWAEEGV